MECKRWVHQTGHDQFSFRRAAGRSVFDTDRPMVFLAGGYQICERDEAAKRSVRSDRGLIFFYYAQLSAGGASGKELSSSSFLRHPTRDERL
jgi:hypothetical protein